MTTLADLRRLAEQLPEGAALTLPKAVLLELLPVMETPAPCPAPDTYTVATLAALLHRSPSTVRAWVEAGLFPGAYKLPGDPRRAAWRVPASAVEAFAARGRAASSPDAPGRAISAPVAPRHRPHLACDVEAPDLGAWRKVREAP